MSSELFEKLHYAFRNLKDKHSIDLLHPMGATIHGRNYPAINKYMVINSKAVGHVPPVHEAYFHMPFENGHMLAFYHRQENPSSSYDPKSLVSLGLLVPTSTISKHGTWLNHNYTNNAENPPFHEKPEEFHKTIQKVSQEPFSGYISDQRNNDYVTHMSSEDHRTFLDNYEGERMPPHIIKVIHTPNSTPDSESWRFHKYHYDIKTEQLRKAE